MTGTEACFFATAVTSAASSGRVPYASPPAFTLGQEILTSIISTPASESFSHISPYSSGVLPEMLAMIFMS